ncbi:lysophospholipase [Pseudomarimonas salicorniae]|uniref:Lysophospholipase n=1 Tax=Pseudomarimonas salicorniae TaxID=2933270 RepID=A0ABT0GH22_9GAMM|nr:lysophospholipase [Lysobacter sp. CAU 1642]MCK7593846.1 lysophospholipase [Lysobacter sp. CAU 1642]
MPGHVILSHGLNSSPAAAKVSALAAVAERLGWTHERPDYSAIDARMNVDEIQARLSTLLERCAGARRPLVLAGSSMGAFISALASLEVPCAGLFLIAPPVNIDGFPRSLRAAVQPTMVVHGWSDDVCPVGDVIRWTQRRRDRLLLVDDGHRLDRHVDLCAEEFGRFLSTLK